MKSCTVNRQIGDGDSKYVIIFDPLCTGHVILRFCTAHGREQKTDRPTTTQTTITPLPCLACNVANKHARQRPSTTVRKVALPSIQMTCRQARSGRSYVYCCCSTIFGSYVNVGLYKRQNKKLSYRRAIS